MRIARASLLTTHPTAWSTVLDNLQASLSRRPRTVTLVCAFPRHLLLEAGFLQTHDYRPLPSCRISVFSRG